MVDVDIVEIRDSLTRQEERMKALTETFKEYCRVQEANCRSHDAEIEHITGDVRVLTTFMDRAKGAMFLWPTIASLGTGLVVGLTIFAAGRVWPLPH